MNVHCQQQPAWTELAMGEMANPNTVQNSTLHKLLDLTTGGAPLQVEQALG
jgi:hypothetical protein